MPMADIVYNADIAQNLANFYKKGDEYTMNENNMNNPSQKCNLEVGYPWCPVPIPPPPMPAPFPPPPFPPYYPPYPIDPDRPTPEPDPGSVSQQICKLSRKANVITKMLENLETKKKDVIVSVGGISYNFGNIDLSIDGWTDGSYAATIKTMLEFELNLIKTKIAELAGDLGEDADLSASIETTVGG